MKDRFGKAYGWGVAQYTTPEHFFGYDYITSAYSFDTTVSKQKIIDHLKEVLPTASEQQILKIMRI